MRLLAGEDQCTAAPTTCCPAACSAPRPCRPAPACRLRCSAADRSSCRCACRYVNVDPTVTSGVTLKSPRPLEAPDARVVEVGAHEHRHRRHRHEHRAVGGLRVIGWPPIVVPTAPGRQDQRLLLDVAVDVVDEHAGVRARLARCGSCAPMSKFRLRLRRHLLDRIVRWTWPRPSAVDADERRCGRPTSGAATSNPDPVRPSVPRSVMCGAR